MTMQNDLALERLLEQIRAALAQCTPLEIRGHGSKDFLRPGAPAPCGRPLDMTELCGISAYEPTELVVTVRAGTPLLELEAALAEQGQFLAFEPPRFTGRDGQLGGTVGGMVAAGLAGPSRACVGSVRDFVLGASMINGRAELLSFGGQVMKNVAGYDLSRLLAGSQGVLGVICEVSLKVLPQPVATATLRFALSQVEALEYLRRWSRQALPLNASVWLDGQLLLRLSGARAAVEAARQALGGDTLPADVAAAFWDSVRDQRHAFFTAAQQSLHQPDTQRQPGLRLWRVSVPPHAPALALPGDWLIEWSGGLRWLLSSAAPEQVRAAAAQAGGHASVYRSRVAAERQPAALAPVLERLHRQIKDAFDPHHLFNPGRLVQGL
ncbi:MAG: glycolate oxidase subunit GlcE [Leptothrix sp. (in: b-proteobacteria)]